ncbi:hypothetical protein [Paracoccus litorisediminis]|uniref:Uncharacterized protein n=1 Tax=Paracoccus litorisediminis TaxID=2006130 RepID=A0A844HQJ6_9RHOB|nr:hypothetical protein [Paracoccus litorisediminis]MTH61429.1 hypothetical protein [Paracoccus litorisediminis]
MSNAIEDSAHLKTLLKAARVAHQRLVFAGDHANDLGLASRASADYAAAEKLGQAIARFESSKP